MSKILKSTTLGNVKNGGIFKALGKEFVKLDADEHGCLVLAKDIWTRMPFRDGDDPEYPNDLRRSEIMPYLGNCLAEFTAKRWIVFMKVADMEGKTDNSQKKEEHDSLKPARDAIATAMRAAQFAKATGTPLPKPLKWQREFYDATGVFPYGWYECPVCGYRTDWEPHACPICHTLLEP